MTIEETRKKILEDDEFVMSEFHKLQYFYGLKDEIRYHLSRSQDLNGDSVAEHVYGMMVVASYFLPLEDIEGELNKGRIYDLITWHDMDEIEVGDVIGYLKTKEHRDKEAKAENVIIEKTPAHMQETVKNLLAEYGARTTRESKFVKAVDKLEPVLHLFNDRGKALMHHFGTTRAQHNELKVPYLAEFPYLKRFHEVTEEELEKQGYYTPDA